MVTGSASVAVVVFTRDLRVDDHPALADAARDAEHVVPLFVFDDAILAVASTGPTGPGSCSNRCTISTTGSARSVARW